MSEHNTLRISAVQINRCSIDESFQKIESVLKDVEAQRPDIVVLPEKWITDRLTEDDPKFLNLLGRFLDFSKLYGCSIVPGSFSIVRNGVTFNSAPMISGGELLGFQDKISLYRGEKASYEHGSEVNVFRTKKIAVTIAICYDLDFPYYTKLAVKGGAGILVNPSLIEEKFHGMWQVYVRGRSLENRIPVISVNSLSTPFGGNSIITGIKVTDEGVFLLDHLAGKQELTTVDLDLQGIEKAMLARIQEDPGFYSIQQR